MRQSPRRARLPCPCVCYAGSDAGKRFYALKRADKISSAVPADVRSPLQYPNGRSPMHSRADSVLDEASETCLRGTTQDDDYLCTAGAQ